MAGRGSDEAGGRSRTTILGAIALPIVAFGFSMGISCWLVMVQMTTEPAHVTEDLLRTRPIEPWAPWVAGIASFVGLVLFQIWWRASQAAWATDPDRRLRTLPTWTTVCAGFGAVAGPALVMAAAPQSDLRWRPMWLLALMIGATCIAIARDRLGPRPAQRAWAWWTKPQRAAAEAREPAGQDTDRRS